MDTIKLSMIMIVIVTSFIGFCVENIFSAYLSGVINNRNMILPFLLGYGLAIIALYALFGTPDAPRFLHKELLFNSSIWANIYYFSVSFLCVCLGEITLGYMTQWCCGIIWWNYSEIPLHITKYTSIPTSFGFATLITIFMKYCFDFLQLQFTKMNPRVLAKASVFILTLLIIDFIHSGIYMFKKHDTLKIWTLRLPKPLKYYFNNKI